MPYFPLKRGEQAGGISPHASTHHTGGTDPISAEAIGARPMGVDIDWEEISDPPDFAAPTESAINYVYGTGWIPYNSQYLANFRRLDKLIVLAGLVTRTTTTGNLIATLPIGYRPPSRRLFDAPYRRATGDPLAIARIDVWSNGDVTLEEFSISSSIAWISLDKISFFVA